jgi:ATP-dependent Clp protease ATP-binding subunit ClpA
VVFRSLQEHHLRQILNLELQAVQSRIHYSNGASFIFECSDAVKEMLLKEGTDPKYGARHLKRAVERLLVHPLANLVETKQIRLGDFVYVDLRRENGKMVFSRYCSGDASDKAHRPERARSGNRPQLAIGGFYPAV